MDNKPKPALAIMIGKAMDAKKGKQEEPIEDSEYDSDEHLHEISKDLIDAVESKDPDAVAELLKEAFDCIERSKSEEE